MPKNEKKEIPSSSIYTFLRYKLVIFSLVMDYSIVATNERNEPWEKSQTHPFNVIPLWVVNQAERLCSRLVGEGQGTVDAEDAGGIGVGGDGLEGQGDTGGDVRGDGDALGDGGGGGGNGAGVGTSDQTGAQVSGLIVDVDSP